MLYNLNKQNKMEVYNIMIQYNCNTYEAMLGNISEQTMKAAASCIAQCTGCMCNCRCSCSGGIIADFEWEAILR